MESPNLLENQELKKGQKQIDLIKILFVITAGVLPWLFFVPSKYAELLKQSFLFLMSSLILGVCLLLVVKRDEMFWRKNFLNGLLSLFLVILLTAFLYSENHTISWSGYQGNFTSGISEYLAFILFFFLGTQFVSKKSWRQNLEIFVFSSSIVFIFLIFLAYLGKSEFLSANFARTPSLLSAVLGVTAVSFWWLLKSKENVLDWMNLFSLLTLFFVSSILDYSLSWWVWVFGVGTIIFFDFLTKTRDQRVRDQQRQIGASLDKEGTFIRKVVGGKSKYLFFIFLFSFSQAISPIILRTEKISIMPYYETLSNYPILIDKIFFYLLLELFVIIFGVISFLRGKTEKNLSLAIAGSFVGVFVGQIVYYSESTLLYFLIWVLLVLASSSFLRRKKELDFLLKIESPKGKTTLRIFSLLIFLFFLFLAGLRIKELF